MRRPINGDGFGVGYYPPEEDEEIGGGPCVMCGITPAWNNLNLARLAEKTKSSLVFAHVRASTAGVLSETNCHPFNYGNLMFMHNGHVSDFSKFKRRLADMIDERFFLHVQGSTDSEWCFALFLDCLLKLGVDPSSSSIPAEKMREALFETLRIINELTKSVGATEPSLLNIAITDGSSVVVSRYVTSSTQEAASLHFSAGSRFYEYEKGQYRMERDDRAQNVILVASEPLTFERGDWITVPTNTVLSIQGQTVLMHPVKDEYYSENPHHTRSSDFAESKGLVSPVVISSGPDSVPPLEREGRRMEIAV